LFPNFILNPLGFIPSGFFLNFGIIIRF
jgi:hypothetical protein